MGFFMKKMFKLFFFYLYLTLTLSLAVHIKYLKFCLSQACKFSSGTFLTLNLHTYLPEKFFSVYQFVSNQTDG